MQIFIFLLDPTLICLHLYSIFLCHIILLHGRARVSYEDSRRKEKLNLCEKLTIKLTDEGVSPIRSLLVLRCLKTTSLDKKLSLFAGLEPASILAENLTYLRGNQDQNKAEGPARGPKVLADGQASTHFSDSHNRLLGLEAVIYFFNERERSSFSNAHACQKDIQLKERSHAFSVTNVDLDVTSVINESKAISLATLLNLSN